MDLTGEGPRPLETEEIELSVVMPCLNEADTLGACIERAREGALRAEAKGFEIIVADNGSEDDSRAIALAQGARVVEVKERGYGSALRAGFAAARGTFVVMGDSDASYDFAEIPSFLTLLRQGCPMVVGSRFRGTIRRGAMPPLHRYLGNPVLTAIANLLFRTNLTDYHCGLRGFRLEAVRSLTLRTSGMEFASEMIVRAALAGLDLGEVPITYSPAGRSRPPHLRSWRDGWRHLRFLLLFSPRWLFLYPGLALILLGALLSALLLAGPFRFGGVTFDVHTLLFAETSLALGAQLVLLGVFARVYASRSGLLPGNQRLERMVERFSLGLGLVSGLALTVVGAGLYVVGVTLWGQGGFGPLADTTRTLRIAITGTTMILLGGELFFGSFVVSLLGLEQAQPTDEVGRPA